VRNFSIGTAISIASRSAFHTSRRQHLSHANVPKPDPSSAEVPVRLTATEEWRRRIFSLACDMEKPLDQALAFASALDLIGFGLRTIADDHAPALLAVAEAMTAQITTTKETWRQLMAVSTHKPRARSRRTPKPRHARRK